MERLELNGRTSGKMKTFCPLCREQRKNKRDKSVSVDLDKGVAKCHYCEEVFYRNPPMDNRRGASRSARNITPEKKKQTEIPREVISGGSRTAPTEEHIQWFAQERGISRETLERMGVTSSEEYMPQTGKKEMCICFNYYEEGKLVNTKYRDLEKNFKMRAGAEVIPYNIDGIKGTPECIFVEGEIDELSFVEIGRTDVISVPTGANVNLGWLDRFVKSHLEDKRVIYIAVDNDRKGLELQKELVRRLGAGRCRIVEYPEGGKDANEVLTQMTSPYPLLEDGDSCATTKETALDNELCANLRNSAVKSTEHHQMNDAGEALKKCLAEAPEAPLEGVYTLKNVSDELRTLFEKGMQRGAETGWENLDKYCTFETGRLCVLGGMPGSGKSEFLDELLIRLNIRHGWKTAFFSPENMPLVYHLRKLMEKATGLRFKEGQLPEALYSQAEKYIDENFCSILPEDNFTVDNILAKAKEIIRRKGTKVLGIDPINKFEHLVPAGQTETQYISALLDKFTNFALQNDCLVILVVHPRKMYKEPGSKREPVPTLYDMNGSAAFYNKCDFGMTVERDQEAGVSRIHVQKVKFKHLGGKGIASFVYNIVNGRYSPCEENNEYDGAKRIQNTQFDNEPWV